MKKLALLAILAVVVACGVGAVNAIARPDFWAQYEAAKQARAEPAQAQVDAENAAQVEPYLIGAGGLLVVLFLFGTDIARRVGKSLLVLIFFISLLAGAGYLYAFADKNADGQADPQVIRAIQPSGVDVKTDAAYSEVNNKNAEANMANTLTLGFFFVLISICIFLLGFVSMFFRSARERLEE